MKLDELELLIKQLKLRGYSDKTIRAYKGHVQRFHAYRTELYEREGTDASNQSAEKEVQSYSLYLLGKGRSHSFVNQAISALKFHMKHVRGECQSVAFVRLKKEIKLPKVLSSGEVLALLKVVRNEKHAAILYLLYSAGLRVSEVVRLRLSDLDFERKTITIRQGKGKKDRLTLLSAAAVVNKYVNSWRKGKWLFPGQNLRGHLTERSVQKLFERYKYEVGIQKPVSVHSLRHSFATHLWKAAQIYGTFRSCWGIKAAKQQNAIHM